MDAREKFPPLLIIEDHFTTMRTLPNASMQYSTTLSAKVSQWQVQQYRTTLSAKVSQWQYSSTELPCRQKSASGKYSNTALPCRQKSASGGTAVQNYLVGKSQPAAVV